MEEKFPLNLGFDAKRLFLNKAGLGNYSRWLVKGLINQFPENQYHLYTTNLSDIQKEFAHDKRVDVLVTQGSSRMHLTQDVAETKIAELAEKSNFMEVCYLLLKGELPNKKQYEEFCSKINQAGWPGSINKQVSLYLGPAQLLMARIGLAEDDEKIAGLVSNGLREQGYEVIVASNGIDALHFFEHEKSDKVSKYFKRT